MHCVTFFYVVWAKLLFFLVFSKLFVTFFYFLFQSLSYPNPKGLLFL